MTKRSDLDVRAICLNICGDYYTPDDTVLKLMVDAYTQGQKDNMDYVKHQMEEMVRRYKDD